MLYFGYLNQSLHSVMTHQGNEYLVGRTGEGSSTYQHNSHVQNGNSHCVVIQKTKGTQALKPHRYKHMAIFLVISMNLKQLLASLLLLHLIPCAWHTACASSGLPLCGTRHKMGQYCHHHIPVPSPSQYLGTQTILISNPWVFVEMCIFRYIYNYTSMSVVV